MKSSPETEDLLFLLSVPGGGLVSEGVTQPTLVMTGGPLDGTTYPLAMTAKELILGSSMDADVQIMLGNVEPHHARLAFGTAGLIIADAGSATGTFVNGEKVEAEQPLQEGDRICLGPPGAKGSAKLLGRRPGGAAGPVAGAPATGAAVEEEQPLLIDDSEGSPLLLEGDAQPTALPVVGSEPAQAPPASAEADLAGEEILAAEEVPADDGAPLEATEVPADEGGALFDTPLPPTPPQAPAPAEPAAEEPPAPPPAPPPAAVPAAPITAPPTAEYQTDLPSIPLATSEEPEGSADAEPAPLLSEPLPAPAPPPARARPGTRGRRQGRRKQRSSIPIVPVAGGLILVLALGAAGWWFFLRPGPEVATPAPPPTAAQPAQAAPPPGTPHVRALEPDVALPGETILIRGESLADPVSVTIGGTPVETETTAEGFRVVMPDLQLTEGQRTELVVQAGGTVLEPVGLYVGRSPLVLQLTPSRGPMGERVVIKGRGFPPDPDGNTVTFGGAPGLVLTASTSEIAAVAPEIPVSEAPAVPVVVTVGGRASSGKVQYFVSRATTSSFTPGFFAAPVTRYPGEPLAFVSTRIGSVLLLGGSGTSESTALRAAEVSTVLNRLVASARSKKIEIEYRPRPAPSVAVAGEVDPFLTATAEDAAAYSRALGVRIALGSTGGSAQSRSALGGPSAGLLRPLPVQGTPASHAGPLATLTGVHRHLLCRATALGGPRDSHEHRVPHHRRHGRGSQPGGARGVQPDTARGGGDQRAPGRAASTIRTRALVASRCSSRWRDKGVTGSMKTWRGSIELGSPLRDITFGRGTVRFTADLQGKAHKFEGALEDNSISGTATREGRAPASFTLEYAE